MNCEQCQIRLFDLMEGELPDQERRSIDQHVETCIDCQAALGRLWELEAAATRWKRQPVPRWNRRDAFFEPRSWLPATQLVGAAASILLLVVVVAQLRIDMTDGLVITFGPDYVTESEISERLAALETSVGEELRELGQQQAAGDQLVLTSLLHTSRRERREDMADLVSVMNDAEARRDMRTREALQYLITTQQEDRKDIQQLNQALQLVGNSGGTL